MNASRIPSRLAEPPPAPAAVPFDLVLFDGEREVGWIAPGRIGFRGFANEVEAAHAAWVAHRAVARRLAQRDGRRPVPIDMELLSIVRRDDDIVVSASGRQVARLIPPGGVARPGLDSFAFELQLDNASDEISVRAKAHLAYATLRRAGVRWSMWLRSRSNDPGESP